MPPLLYPRGEIHASGDRPRFFQEEKRVFTTPSSPSFPSFFNADIAFPSLLWSLSRDFCIVIFFSTISLKGNYARGNLFLTPGFRARGRII